MRRLTAIAWLRCAMNARIAACIVLPAFVRRERRTRCHISLVESGITANFQSEDQYYPHFGEL